MIVILRIVFSACVILLITNLSIAESAKSPCIFDEFQIATALVDSKVECDGVMLHEDLMEVITIVDAFWNWDTSNTIRYGFLSREYKALLKSDGVSSAGQYFIPEYDIERTWDGYRLENIAVYGKDRVEVKMTIQWSQEGRSGTKTYIFSFRKLDGKWEIVGIYN